MKYREDQSRDFEMEVKNLLYIEIPTIKPYVANYLAKRIDVLRLTYEARSLNKKLRRRDSRCTT